MIHKPDVLLPVETLSVPDNLLPSAGKLLPELDIETLDALSKYGWKRIGILAVFIDTDMNVMMLKHNGRDKNQHNALGVLGETSQQSGPVVEQPMETLFRGIEEELGVSRPQDLDLWMHQEAGWLINQWPLGNSPDEFGCGIAFPIFVTDTAKTRLLSFQHGTDEISGIEFIASQNVLSAEDQMLRPGVKNLLNQMDAAQLLMPRDDISLCPVDFTSLYSASLQDISL